MILLRIISTVSITVFLLQLAFFNLVERELIKERTSKDQTSQNHSLQVFQAVDPDSQIKQRYGTVSLW